MPIRWIERGSRTEVSLRNQARPNMRPLKQFGLILCRPKFPGNVGSCARAATCFGVSDFRLVAPACDWRSDDALKMAVPPSREVLESARTFDTLESALADFTEAVGFTRRSGKRRNVHFPFSTCPALSSPRGRIALVFGNEEFGLDDEELMHCAFVAGIPTDSALESLNLSHAVAVVLARLFEDRLNSGTAAAKEANDPRDEAASHVELEGLFDHWRQALEDAGVTSAGNPDRMARKIRRILQRAALSSRDAKLLRGYLSKTQWAMGARQVLRIHRSAPPGPHPKDPRP